LDQLTINRYPPGVGLAPHVDVHSSFEDPIASLSLGSSAVMEFRRGRKRRPLLLPRRSLTIMTGESRYAWCETPNWWFFQQHDRQKQIHVVCSQKMM
jgi:alkylated DNA repair protein alkB family protein 8